VPLFVCEKKMTDSFAVAGDFLPAEFASTDAVDTADAALVQTAAPQAEPLAPEPEALPNGFLTLGLAPELLQAVNDLGFTQPTTVQLRTIPLAMQGTGQAAVKFNDLMVSSQTGSGKTAAFLLPVLHTLLKQPVRMPLPKVRRHPNAPNAKTPPTRAISRRRSPVP
jgi:superfamily II DNA/RNA helicase